MKKQFLSIINVLKLGYKTIDICTDNKNYLKTNEMGDVIATSLISDK